MNAEKNLISLIKETFGEASQKLIGDDCAVLPVQASLHKESLLVSTDAMVEGIHFLPDIEPYYLGWKVVAVNLSDIAAMGGSATNLFLAASLPAAKLANEFWMKDFLRGIFECCTEHSVLLSGGDITASDKLYLCGTIIGHTVNSKVAKRSQAQPGQVILASCQSLHKSLGCSAAGLWILQNGALHNSQDIHKFPACILAHSKPQPRLLQGQQLLESVSSPIAMMDTSDGLLDCLQQIADQSGVLMSLDLTKLFVHSELKELAALAKVNLNNWLISGGEDYELIATCFADEMSVEVSRDWAIVGEVKALPPGQKQKVEILNQGVLLNVDSLKTFDHFC